jgi:translation initiation factor 3 subunit C
MDLTMPYNFLYDQDYVVRLSDEASLIELAEEIFRYYCRVGDDKAASMVALLRIEHLYYKHDTVAVAVQRSHHFTKTWGRYADLHPASLGKIDETKLGKLDSKLVHPGSFIGNPKVDPELYDTSSKVEELCQFIYKNGDERLKTRALLCSVFHHALHDRYYRARDLFLMSHIQDMVDRIETHTQILYNRALVTLGLAAFRQGLIQKCHECLSNICSGKVKELLAQGQAKGYEKDPEQEKIERRRQIPYHMHINPDLLECCHMISAMFLELPHFTKPSGAANPISKTFRKYMTTYNRQVCLLYKLIWYYFNIYFFRYLPVLLRIYVSTCWQPQRPCWLVIGELPVLILSILKYGT